MKTLIEIHALQNFAPSNLNRDDTGAPKDAIFGGTRRARVSSQCLKRAIRQYFGALIECGKLLPADVATRTKRLLDAVTEALVSKGRTQVEASEKVRAALAAIELTIKDDNKSQYLLFLGEREIRGIVEVIDEKWEEISAAVTQDEGKKGGKAKKNAAKNADPALKKALEKVLNGGKALDIALFGRMLADMPEKNQNAACQVAHAISTHSVEREFDFYTAVDDRKPEDSAGADMIGTIEFNSACFYRYAVVDWEALVKNLQMDEELATKGLHAFLEGFVVAEPTGKQNSFAAHNAPELVVATIRRNGAPRNLANAFETAVRPKKDESLTGLSAVKLFQKATSLRTAFGGDESTYVLNLTSANFNGLGTEMPSLKELVDSTLLALKA